MTLLNVSWMKWKMWNYNNEKKYVMLLNNFSLHYLIRKTHFNRSGDRFRAWGARIYWQFQYCAPSSGVFFTLNQNWQLKWQGARSEERFLILWIVMRKEPKAMMNEHELFRPANSILYNFRDNFQILGMGNQSSTMGYHKPPGDLTTTIIKIITITFTPGLVTPAHHRPNHHHHDHHHLNNHRNIDSRTGDPGPPSS